MPVSPLFATIIIILVGTQLIETAVSLLNISRMGKKLPSEFADIFSERDYARSQEYTRAQTRFDLLRGWFWILIIIAAIWTNAFNRLDVAVRGFEFPETVSGLVFLGAVFLAADILSLPFEIYHTFGLEEKFGMNRTTVRTFIVDKIKGYVLAIILGGALAWPILTLLREAGGMAWIYCTLAFGLFILIMQYAGPTLILPMFNKFTPITDEELKDKIFKLAEAAHFPLKEIYIMDGSKRSAKGNAFFAGIGKSRRIALFDTLLGRLTHSEILSVLGHEMGHFRLKHIYKGFLATVVKAALLFWLLNLFVHTPSMTASLGMAKHSVHASIIFFAFLYIPVGMLLGIYGKWRSRKNEYEADAFAADICRAESLISALKKLSRNNLGNLTPHPAFVFLHFSHPPVLERIKALRNFEICEQEPK